MARTWLQIRVDLLGGRGIELEPTPGRMMLVGPAHTFEQFAEAIDAAFARWDLSHMHEFELADGRRIGFADDDFDPEPEFLDHAAVKVAQEVEPGDEFTYTFDLGDDWRHRCVADKQKADPEEEYGPPPARPVAIFGWGSIPDQYGRRSFDDDDRDNDEDA